MDNETTQNIVAVVGWYYKDISLFDRRIRPVR